MRTFNISEALALHGMVVLAGTYPGTINSAGRTAQIIGASLDLSKNDYALYTFWLTDS